MQRAVGVGRCDELPSPPPSFAHQATNVFSAFSFHVASLSFTSHTFCALCSFCSFYSTLSNLFIMSDAEFFATLCNVQLLTDSAATFATRTVFSSEAAIQHLIEESSLTFAPGLADMIRSRDTPFSAAIEGVLCSALQRRSEVAVDRLPAILS